MKQLIYLLALLIAMPISAAINVESIVSTKGSKYEVWVDDGTGEFVFSTHSQSHTATLSVLKWLQDNCESSECTGYVRRELEWRVTVSNAPSSVEECEVTTGGGSGTGTGDDPGTGTGDDPGPATPKSVTLSWTNPTTRQNGSTLSDSEISKYEIAVVGENNDYSSIVTVDHIPGNASQTEVIPNLEPDTYYFSIRTIDKDGLTSEWSDSVQTTF